MSRLLIGVTGGIAAYKALETARLAIAAGHAVRVIQTPSSRRFVGSDSFAGITGAPVLCSEFQPDPLRGAYPGDGSHPPDRAPITHLALVARADAYLIAPASANTIAKLAGGLADNLVTTAALAAGGRDGVPVLVAPAMNDRMYRHPATQANLARLAQRGVTIVGPGEGRLASHGEHGLGRMSEPAELLAACSAVITDGSGTPPWRGLRVLVTAGGTREPIDSVRYISNRSSGRMGIALARGAVDRGAEVTLVAANVSLPMPDGVRPITVETAAELAAACEHEFASCDVLLMAAAVADFRPRDPSSRKLRKSDSPTPPRLELEATPDVLTGLAARRRPGQVLVAFAAEDGDDAIGHGRGKLARKQVDAVVVNDISRPGIGFDAPDNEVTILVAGGSERRLSKAGKDVIADGVLQTVEMLLTANESEDRVDGADPDRAAGV